MQLFLLLAHSCQPSLPAKTYSCLPTPLRIKYKNPIKTYITMQGPVPTYQPPPYLIPVHRGSICSCGFVAVPQTNHAHLLGHLLLLLPGMFFIDLHRAGSLCHLDLSTTTTSSGLPCAHTSVWLLPPLHPYHICNVATFYFQGGSHQYLKLTFLF